MKIFFKSIFYTLLAILISFLVVSQNFWLISIFIIAFYVNDKINEFFEENKINIIDKKLSPFKENRKTFGKISLLGFGIMLWYLLIMYFFNWGYLQEMFKEILISLWSFAWTGWDNSSFIYILLPNIAFLFIGLVFTLFFRWYAVALSISLWAVFLGINIWFLLSNNLSWWEIVSNFLKIIIPYFLIISSLISWTVWAYFVEKWFRKYILNKNNIDKKIFKSIVRSVSRIFLISIILNIIWTLLQTYL